MSSPLSFLIIGAGAIGSYVGGSLALHGSRVVFLDRPQAVAQLRERGIRLNLPDGERSLTPVLAASISEALALGPFEAGIFSVKSYHSESALAPLIPFAGQLPPIVCLQNGVDNEPLLAQALGADKVIAGTVTTAIGRPAPGVTAVERLRGIGLAVEPGSPTRSLVQRVGAAMNQAGLQASLYSRPADMKWSKLLTNLTANATAAILDMTPAEIFAHPGLVRVEIEQQREALRVMQALGVQVTSLPGTPVPLFAFAVTYLPLFLAQPVLRRAIGRGRGGKCLPCTSICTEEVRPGVIPRAKLFILNGAVAAYGAKAGVPTPVNRFLNDTLLSIVNGVIPKRTFNKLPDTFLAQLSNA